MAFKTNCPKCNHQFAVRLVSTGEVVPEEEKEAAGFSAWPAPENRTKLVEAADEMSRSVASAVSEGFRKMFDPALWKK